MPRRGRKVSQDPEGKAKLDQVIDNIEKERKVVVQKNVDKFFEHKKDDKKDTWVTEIGGLAPEGELLTLEDLMYLKPFEMTELNSTVAFRANDKMMRSFQRLKEASGNVYDIMSDLYRDAAAIGLLVLSERHKSILGLEIAISKMENIARQKEEAVETVRRLRSAIKSLEGESRKSHFRGFMTAMEERPKWIQETYLIEMRNDRILDELLDELSAEE